MCVLLGDHSSWLEDKQDAANTLQTILDAITSAS